MLSKVKKVNCVPYKKKYQYLYKVNCGNDSKAVCREGFASVHGLGTKRLCRVAASVADEITRTDKRDMRHDKRCISDDLRTRLNARFCASHYAHLAISGDIIHLNYVSRRCAPISYRSTIQTNSCV